MTTMTCQPAVESHLPILTVPLNTPFERIAHILGQVDGDLPRVTEQALHTFSQHLLCQIALDQTIYHPDRTDPRHRGVIVAVLDPLEQSEDVLFSGIHCRIVKSGYVLDVPIVELAIPQDCSASQTIEDYRYWFWNWK